MNSLAEILDFLKSQADPHNVEGMARFGINPHNTLGVSMPVLRKTAKQIGKQHRLAMELWDSGIHEARILAALTAEPQALDEELMEKWVKDFDSWDVCDQVCLNLFRKFPLVYRKIREWGENPAEFTRRAGFVLIATLAVHDKKAPDQIFLELFPLIRRQAVDKRNMVKKAVN